jgi:hypothetical protein
MILRPSISHHTPTIYRTYHYLSQPASRHYKHVTHYRRPDCTRTALMFLCGAGYLHKSNKQENHVVDPRDRR